ATEEKLTDFRTGIYNNLDAAIESENFMFGADMKDNEEKYKGYLRILEKISKGDSPPPKRNYENVLKTRLDLLEWGRIQEKDIKLVNQVTKRLTLINKKLCSDSDPLITEAKTIYLAKKYLAQMAAASVLRLSENIRTREFMERLSPKMGKFQGTRIPYKITYNHFREFANNLRDYVALFAKMKAGIQNLEINSDEHAILMKTIMDRSLCDLSLLDKKKLAGSVIVALKAGSLFNNEGTQGVKGVRNTANLVFDKLQSRSRFNNYLLMNLFAKPFYLREIETLKALVGLRCYQYHAINALKLILTRMENGYSSETSLWDGMQERLEEFQPPKEKYLKDTRGLFYGHRKKYQRIKNRLEKWNESSGDERDRILKEVKYYLSVLCEGTQKPGEGDCSDED
ncbi:MAG: hypothetical protein GY765_22655, partial [bacterium]|nr:hypothetical protein [bacterium]